MMQEFAAFARARDVADRRKDPFELPYAIDGDRVGGLTIKLIFNKLDRWSKALKYMVADLKWALKCALLPTVPHNSRRGARTCCSHISQSVCEGVCI